MPVQSWFSLNFLGKSCLWKNILCNFKTENWIAKCCGIDSDKHQNQDLKTSEKLYLPSLKWVLDSHTIMLVHWKCNFILKCQQQSGGKHKIWKLQSSERNTAEAKSPFHYIESNLGQIQLHWSEGKDIHEPLCSWIKPCTGITDFLNGPYSASHSVC